MTDDKPTRKARPPRVVIDSSVIVSALVFGGGEAALLRQAWQAGRCRPMVCQATVDDLVAKLHHPRFGFTQAERQTLLAEYLPHALKVRLNDAAPAGAPSASRALASAGDLEALALVRLAMAGRAHAVISGDAELLALNGRFFCPVVTLDAFIEVLAGQRVLPPRRDN